MLMALGWNPRRNRLFLGRCGRNQFLQFAVRKPAVVGIAGVAESFRQRPARCTQFSRRHHGCDG